MFNKDNFVVYTCLMGPNEGINPQPVLSASGYKAICFTDDTSLESSDWEIRILQPLLPFDNHRSQRDVKLRPHMYLREFKYSLYIDNTILMEQPIDELIKYIGEHVSLSANDPFVCIPYHSFRDNVLEEFNECASDRLCDQYRLFEQLKDYSLFQPELLAKKPYWCGMLLRHHLHHGVIQFSENWFSQISKYSRRDQLSVISSESQSGIDISGFILDNHVSPFHRWPILAGERKNRVVETKLIDCIPANFMNKIEVDFRLQREQLAHAQETLSRDKEAIARDKEEVRVVTSRKIFKIFRKLLDVNSKIRKTLLAANFYKANSSEES